MSQDGKVWRRCQKCRVRARYTKSQSRCRQTIRGWGGRLRYCWGVLDAAEYVKKKSRLQSMSPQERAARRRDQAKERIDELIAVLIRTAALVKKWQTKAVYYEQRANLTDVQIQEAKTKHADYKTRKARRRRGITVAVSS